MSLRLSEIVSIVLALGYFKSVSIGLEYGLWLFKIVSIVLDFGCFKIVSIVKLCLYSTGYW